MIPQASEITSLSRSILHSVYSAREDWRFVAIYADQGITGTRTKKREDFLRLMREVKRLGIAPLSGCYRTKSTDERYKIIIEE